MINRQLFGIKYLFLEIVLLSVLFLSSCHKNSQEHPSSNEGSFDETVVESESSVDSTVEEAKEEPSEESPDEDLESADSVPQETAVKKKKSKLIVAGTIVQYNEKAVLSFLLDEGCHEDEEGIQEIPLGEEIYYDNDLLEIRCQENVEILNADGQEMSRDDIHPGQWVEIYSPNGSILESFPGILKDVDKIKIMGERADVEQGIPAVLEGEVIKISSKNKRILKVQSKNADGEPFVCRVDLSMSAVLKADKYDMARWKEIKVGDQVIVYYNEDPANGSGETPETIKAQRILVNYPLHQEGQGTWEIPAWNVEYSVIEGNLLSIGEEDENLQFQIQLTTGSGEEILICDSLDTIIIGPMGSQIYASSLKSYDNDRARVIYQPDESNGLKAVRILVFDDTTD